MYGPNVTADETEDIDWDGSFLEENPLDDFPDHEISRKRIQDLVKEVTEEPTPR